MHLSCCSPAADQRNLPVLSRAPSVELLCDVLRVRHDFGGFENVCMSVFVFVFFRFVCVAELCAVSEREFDCYNADSRKQSCDCCIRIGLRCRRVHTAALESVSTTRGQSLPKSLAIRLSAVNNP